MKFKSGLDVSSHQSAQSGRYTYQAKSTFYLRISTLPLSLGIESCVVDNSSIFSSKNIKNLTILNT